MDLKDVTKNLTDQTAYRIEQRFEEMMRTNPNYKNLDEANKKLIFGGSYKKLEDAKIAADHFRKTHHKEFARG